MDTRTGDRNAFKQAKLAAGLSTAKLAAATGLSQHYCYSVAGGYVPSPAARAKLAKALGVSEDRLWPLAGAGAAL